MYLNIQCLFFVSLFVSGFSRYLPGHDTNSSLVEETQHAICKIATKDIQASANATITRQLKGVCTSKEMNHRLDQLEKRLLNELNTIKYALGVENYVVPANQDNGRPTFLQNTPEMHNLSDYDYSNTIETEKTEETYNPQKITYRFLHTTGNTNANNNILNKQSEQVTSTEKLQTVTTSPSTAKTFSTSSTTAKNLQVSYKRDLEAAKYNVTIQNTELGKSFLYFWKIYDIKEIFTYSDTHIASPVFYLSGQPLQIKLYPHHLGTNYLAIELSNANNFMFKHRFTIFNQKNAHGDLTSQILGANAPIFRISHQKLSSGDFTVDESLIVKVTIAFHL